MPNAIIVLTPEQVQNLIQLLDFSDIQEAADDPLLPLFNQLLAKRDKLGIYSIFVDATKD